MFALDAATSVAALDVRSEDVYPNSREVSTWVDPTRRPRESAYRTIFLGTIDGRLVNNKDLVPRVPFRGWDYSDVGEMIHFTQSGEPERQSQQWRDFLARTLERFAHFDMDVGDHAIANYRQLVADRQDALNRLFMR